MRFETKKRRPVRNYSSRREQLRLLLLFVPLALVIVIMGRLRDPKTADSVNKFFTPADQQAPIKPPLGRELGAERRPVVADTAPAPEASPPIPSAPIAGARPDLLKTIEDNTYFRTAEKDAWFHFFELLQKEKVDPAQAVDVEYVQLVDQPNVYRGKLVSVRGTARQISKEKPADNDLGLTSYYRVVIQPADGANWPIIIYCLELPKGVSPGDNLAIGVNVTGLFFKKLSYQWQDGLGIAPVIVAPIIQQTVNDASSAENRPNQAADFTSIGSLQPLVEKSSVGDTLDEQWKAGDATFQKILTLSGWDVERLAEFDDGRPLSDAQRVKALELLRRLRSIDSSSLGDWSHYLPLRYELKDTEDVRGKLRTLFGYVTKVTKHKPAAIDAQRLEMPEYFECQLELQNLVGPVTLLTSRVPKDWLRDKKHKGTVLANALFLKRMEDGNRSSSLWIAKEIAWFPGEPNSGESSENVSHGSGDPLFGKSMLGAVPFDVGLLDVIESRGRIRPQERGIFYQLLYIVGRMEPETLVRGANENLPLLKLAWEGQTRGDSTTRYKALAREVVRRAEEGRYSVALLFNDPEPQIGRLFVFDGVAGRAVRVEVGGVSGEGDSTDIAERYNFDQYYELEVFTDDSQNYPLVFCARELPKDFPVGADIHVPVRVAGFFFKNWLYSTRGASLRDETADGKSSGSRAQFAPLLIGASPIVLPKAQPVGHAGRFVLGGLFVLGLIGIWVAAVRFARDDRRFREKTPAASFSLPSGQSLNDLNLPAAEVPMTIQVSGVRSQVSERPPTPET